MLLTYHKVDLVNKTDWWITADAFDRQMAALQEYEVVYLDDYDPRNPRHAVITFDGVYQNVAEVALPILKKWNYPFELFVIGDYIGRLNDFDQQAEPPCRFATLEALDALASAGGRIQWHTATHKRMTGLSPAELDRELEVPPELRDRFAEPHLRWFAYPHGEHDEAIEARVRSSFSGALSCVAGDDRDRFKLNRTTVFEDTVLSASRVSVIVANYNYTRYLPEAVSSVLAQTMLPDELIIIDDASTDGAREVMESYRNDATLVFNERNLGIVGNFRKAVELSGGDYIAFLGADNRMRADYVEKCRAALARHGDAALVYTDMAIFGGRSGLLADRVQATEVGESAAERWKIFLQRFPEPTLERIQWLHKSSFIHGSSMYRRLDYERAGGYRESSRPEDHDLFYRMLRRGRRAIHLPYPLIEYRQHSASQANTVLSLEHALERTRGEVRRLQRENELLRSGWSRYLRYPFHRSSYDARRGIRLVRHVLGRARRALR